MANWVASDNRVNRNFKVCEEAPPVSGVGIVVFGAQNVLLHDNSVHNNKPSGPSEFTGGVVVVSSAELGGGDPENVLVIGNEVQGNDPDLFWDESGTNVTFIDNTCSTSEPPDLCA